jgi:hypothetical protein
VLTNGTAYDVALLTVLPLVTGVRFTEASGHGYARTTHDAWVNINGIGGKVYRVNDGNVEFDAITSDLTVVGWAIFTEGTSDLIVFGPLLDEDGVATEVTFAAGDEPRFLDGELKLGLD